MAELVVAMVIIASVLLVLMAIQTSALVTIAAAEKREQATAFMNETIEQVRAMPWNVLKRGMANNFVTASGGDPAVSGSTVTVEGEPYTLIIAPPNGSPGAQDLSDAWPPLFDATGSHTQTKVDPASPGIEFVSRVYVVESAAGTGAVDIIATISWLDNDTGVDRLASVRTTAYAPSGNCGGQTLDEAPFLSSCQARFTASASSMDITTSLTAYQESTDPISGVTSSVVHPLLPGDTAYAVTVRSADTRTSATSQQVNLVEGAIAYGGSVVEDINGDSLFERGFDIFTLEASDDTSSPNAPPVDPIDVVIPTVPGPPDTRVSAILPNFQLWFRGDDIRRGDIDASATTSCATGIPTGSPCAHADQRTGFQTETRYEFTNAGGTKSELYLYRRDDATTSNDAWAARFIEGSPGASTGCTVLSGPGCIAGAAQADSATIYISDPASGQWTDGVNAGASDGIVYIQGYDDWARVSRGASQKLDGPSVDRDAVIFYWNGTSYSTAYITESSDLTISTIPDLLWTTQNGQIEVIAETVVTVSPSLVTAYDPDDDCEDDLCKITATTGSISVRTNYQIFIVDLGYTYNVTSTVAVNGSSATASFREAPGG